MDPTWGFRPPTPETVIGDRSLTALKMAPSDGQVTAGDERGYEARQQQEGAAVESPPVMKGAWVSLAMLLLVYVSNQWTRSLVYCEYCSVYCSLACVSTSWAYSIQRILIRAIISESART